MSLICGDIHGNYEKAKAFLAYKPQEEHIFLGDYLDQWTAPDQIIYDTARMIFESDAITLVGNHELHYLSNSHGYMHCSGRRDNPIFGHLVNTYKYRLWGAVVRDGYLIVHGGISKLHGRHFDTVEEVRDWINVEFQDFLNSPVVPTTLSPLFDIGYVRGGWQQVSGPFWLTFGRESFDPRFNQVVGHTEGNRIRRLWHGKGDRRTVVICLDTPQYQCFNTVTNKDESFGPAPLTPAASVSDDFRIRDLPQEERQPFTKWLAYQTRPLLEGVPMEEQDGYFPWDYQSWKAGLPIED